MEKYEASLIFSSFEGNLVNILFINADTRETNSTLGEWLKWKAMSFCFFVLILASFFL